MANWLGGTWTSQLDQLKKQVTDFTKDVLVAGEEEETNGEPNGEAVQFPRQQFFHNEEDRLRAECHRLEQLRLETVQEKEVQCQQFRQLLLDKQEEISTLEQMVSGDSAASVSDSDSSVQSISKMLNVEVDQLVGAVNQLLKSQATHVEEVEKLKGTITELENREKLGSECHNGVVEEGINCDEERMKWEKEKTELIEQMDQSNSNNMEIKSKLEQELATLKASLHGKDDEISYNEDIITGLQNEVETLKESDQSNESDIKYSWEYSEKDHKAKECIENKVLANRENELKLLNQELVESNKTLEDRLEKLQISQAEEESNNISKKKLLKELKFSQDEIKRLEREVEKKSSAWSMLREELASNKVNYAQEQTENEEKITVIKKELERVRASSESSGAESDSSSKTTKDIDRIKQLHLKELEKVKSEHKLQLGKIRQEETSQIKTECEEKVSKVQEELLAAQQKLEVVSREFQNKIEELNQEVEVGKQHKIDLQNKTAENLSIATNNRSLQEQLETLLENMASKDCAIENLNQVQEKLLSDVELKNEESESLRIKFEEQSYELNEAKSKENSATEELSQLNNNYLESREALSKKCQDMADLEAKLSQLESENKSALKLKEELEVQIKEKGKYSTENEEAFNKKCEEISQLKSCFQESQESYDTKCEVVSNLEAKLDQLTHENVGLAQAKDHLGAKLTELTLKNENICIELLELKQNYQIKENGLASSILREQQMQDEMANKESGFSFLQDHQLKLNSQLKAKEVTEQSLMLKISELSSKIEDRREEEIIRLTEEKNVHASLQEEKLNKLTKANSEVTKDKEELLIKQKSDEEMLSKLKLKVSSLNEAGQKLTLELDEQAKLLTTSRNKETDLQDAITSLKNINETLSFSDQEHKTETKTLNATIDQLKAELKELAAARKEEVEHNEKDIDESEDTGIDKNMIHVLNEKIRENSLMKSECSHLMSSLATEREERERLEKQLEESVETYSNMNTDAIKKLSLLVRDKDLEISSLNERYKSLLEVIQNEKHIEKKECEKENVSKEKFSTLENEIKRLTEENLRLVQSSDNVHIDTWKNKDIVENSNELLYLKGRIADLENKLNMVGQSRRRYLSEDLATTEVSNTEVKDNSNTPVKLPDQDEATARLAEEARMSSRKLETKQMQLESMEQRMSGIGEELKEERDRGVEMAKQLTAARDHQAQLQLILQEREQEVERTRRSMASLQSLLDEKRSSSESQQAEAMKYIGECRRLEEELGKMGIERDQALAQASSRSEEAADLRREVAGIIEKKRRVEGEVERLRGHLVAVEEGYTNDLVHGEERERELRKRVAHLEDKVRVYTVEQTEATHDATEAVEQLKSALNAATTQRDKFSDQLSTATAQLREKNSALRNLQLALEGFQRQKENELKHLEKNCNARIAVEQKAGRVVEEQLRTAKFQLDRANTGLEAAVRLGEQIENKNIVIANLKQEMNAREDLLKQAQEKINNFNTSNVGKVDRSLVKNIVIGYVTADNTKKLEVLRIVATVLDFNQEERARTGLDGSTGGWLYGLMGGSRSRNPSTSGPPPDLDQSIAQAFVRFLENESSPRIAPTLPAVEMARNKEEQMGRHSRDSPRRPSGSPMPLLLSPMPSLNHTHSILKSVLDERPEGEVVVNGDLSVSGSASSSPAPSAGT